MCTYETSLTKLMTHNKADCGRHKYFGNSLVNNTCLLFLSHTHTHVVKNDENYMKHCHEMEPRTQVPEKKATPATKAKAKKGGGGTGVGGSNNKTTTKAKGKSEAVKARDEARWVF